MIRQSTITLILGSILGLFSCGSDRDISDYFTGPNPSNIKIPVEIDSNFQDYYDTFLDKMGINPNNVSIKLNTLEAPTVGLCYSYSDGVRTIDIDRSYWDRSSDYGREEVVMHELGHCAGNLDHNDNKVTISGLIIPESIMNSTVFGNVYYYSKNRDYYLDELKKELIK